MSGLTEKSLFKSTGSPETEKLTRIDGKPLEKGLSKQLVKAAGWDEWVDEDDEDLRIIDFGEAFARGAEPGKLAQTGASQAPATIFTDNFDYGLDLWRAGIVVRMFYSKFSENDTDIRLCRYIPSCLEQFPFNALGITISL